MNRTEEAEIWTDHRPLNLQRPLLQVSGREELRCPQGGAPFCGKHLRQHLRHSHHSHSTQHNPVFWLRAFSAKGTVKKMRKRRRRVAEGASAAGSGFPPEAPFLVFLYFLLPILTLSAFSLFGSGFLEAERHRHRYPPPFLQDVSEITRRRTLIERPLVSRSITSAASRLTKDAKSRSLYFVQGCPIRNRQLI